MCDRFEIEFIGRLFAIDFSDNSVQTSEANVYLSEAEFRLFVRMDA